MAMRVYRLDGGTGAKGALFAVLIIGVGAVIVAAGVALLLVLATAGAVLGAGVLLYRRLSGKRLSGLRSAHANSGLDPSLEVFASDAAIDGRPVPRRTDALPPG